MSGQFIGVDLGQSQDFTAIAIVERHERLGHWDQVSYSHGRRVTLDLRYLERVELGTPYPEIAERIAQICRAGEIRPHKYLAVDATGVGRPVVDLLRQARPACRLLPVVVTGGEQESTNGSFHHVPKRDIIVGLQVLIQTGSLRIAAGLKHARTLTEEMAAMQVRVTASGYEQYGAWRDGTHDDLVFAVGLACWAARKVYPKGLLGGEG